MVPSRVLLLACLLLAGGCGPGAAAPSGRSSRAPLPTPAPRIEVQGHRGARAVLPEESIPAFVHALEVGVDTLELDLVVTRDGHLVVVHDLTINDTLCLRANGERLTTRPPVRSMTLAEVKALDCGSLVNERFPKQTAVPGAKVVTLAEVFELVERSPAPAARKVGFNVEMKSLPARPELTPPPDEFARKILDEAARHRMLDRVMIQSFDHRMLAAVKRRTPSVPISLLIDGTLPDLVGLARVAGAEVVSPNVEWITAGDVKDLHANGIRVIPWTANTPDEWRYLAGIGVDGIISDDPAALVEWLRAEKLR
jgi:glycerophosphoryl diester phosphodiesterase